MSAKRRRPAKNPSSSSPVDESPLARPEDEENSSSQSLSRTYIPPSVDAPGRSVVLPAVSSDERLPYEEEDSSASRYVTAESSAPLPSPREASLQRGASGQGALSSQASLSSQAYVADRPLRRSQPSRSAEVERVGDVLRRVRLSRREALDDIAEYLRIRPSFLDALEGSRYEELPADAYVIGFLRTYANYLGLDGRLAIDQYRREMSGRRNKPQLNMPQPVSEGPAPTIAIIVSATLAAILLYALWYAFASSDRTEVSVPPPLPQSVQEVPLLSAQSSEQAQIQPQPAPNQAAPGASASADASAPASVPAAVAPGTSAGQAAQGQQAAQPVSPQQQAQLDKAPSQKQEAEQGASHPASQQQGQASLQAVTPQAGSGEGPAQQGTQLPSPSQEASSAKPEPAQAQAPFIPPLPEGVSQGRSFGAKPARARVAISAVARSWISVTDDKGRSLFDRTLKPGEVYYVPQGKALVLTTGNGRGIRLFADGTALPVIGTDGGVIRGFPLDAQILKEKYKLGE